jgi:hypothetical protein
LYLSANSTFANARTYGIQSAVDLWSRFSWIATTNAFYAVGLVLLLAQLILLHRLHLFNCIRTTSTSTNLSWTAATDNVSVTGYNV